jgi:hypothetical protein
MLACSADAPGVPRHKRRSQCRTACTRYRAGLPCRESSVAGEGTSACRDTGFSSRQTTGLATSYGFPYTARTSSIHSRYLRSSSTTHHILSPLRLQVVALEQDPDCLSPHVRHQLTFHRLLRGQAHLSSGQLQESEGPQDHADGLETAAPELVKLLPVPPREMDMQSMLSSHVQA